MNIRTDLALESIAPEENAEIIHVTERGKTFRITDITIDDDSCLETIGKGRGRYITLETENLSRFSDASSDMVQELADELRRFIPAGCILVVGLGNSDITPDAVGPQTIAKVIATRHLRRELGAGNFLSSLRPVASFAGGVLGQTGIETAETVSAVAEKIKPSAIIAVDALACSDISRLGTTIQLTDTGISPGSGVSNARKELSERVMGVPVIAVGVPTVVDMQTIVQSLTGSRAEDTAPNMIVTPRDIDRLSERASHLLGMGINLALQPTLSYEDVRSLY